MARSAGFQPAHPWAGSPWYKPIYAEKDTAFWLAWVFESNPGLRTTTGTPGRAASSQIWAGEMPEEFGSSTIDSYIYSICANYTAAVQQKPITLIGNPYMFTARRYDIETGLYYYRARYYNPDIGRFLQKDPAGQGMNWYAYCGNNSLNCVDPLGLYAVEVDIPLATIWHQSAMGDFVKDKYGARRVTKEDDPWHKVDVQAFLNDSNFDDEFPDVTLTSVTYSGTKNNGTYHCIFEVPSSYINMKMTINTRISGIPILFVNEGHWWSRDKTQILDWRQIGMLNDRLEEYHHSVGHYFAVGLVKAVAGVILTGITAVTATTFPTLAKVTALGAMGIAYWAYLDLKAAVQHPSKSIPNMAVIQQYYGQYTEVMERYNKYKEENGL